MLVVSRKNQQGIQIGKDIVVRIVRTGANRVQIGVEAPDDIRVLRLELTDEELPEYELPPSSALPPNAAPQTARQVGVSGSPVDLRSGDTRGHDVCGRTPSDSAENAMAARLERMRAIPNLSGTGS